MKKNIILVVDDSELEAQLAMMALQDCDKSLTLHHLKDGIELVEYLTCQNQYSHRSFEENQNIRLILLDINMPRMSGLEALKIIRNDSILRGIPVAMLSSSDEAVDVLNSYNLGANSYIKKQIDLQEFRMSMAQTASFWVNVNKSSIVDV